MEKKKEVRSSIPLFQAYIDSFEKGYAAGYAAGYDKGYAEGIIKGKTESALNMHKVGIPFDTICRCTGFTEEQVLHILKTSAQTE